MSETTNFDSAWEFITQSYRDAEAHITQVLGFDGPGDEFAGGNDEGGEFDVGRPWGDVVREYNEEQDQARNTKKAQSMAMLAVAGIGLYLIFSD